MEFLIWRKDKLELPIMTLLIYAVSGAVGLLACWWFYSQKKKAISLKKGQDEVAERKNKAWQMKLAQKEDYLAQEEEKLQKKLQNLKRECEELQLEKASIQQGWEDLCKEQEQLQREKAQFKMDHSTATQQ